MHRRNSTLSRRKSSVSLPPACTNPRQERLERLWSSATSNLLKLRRGERYLPSSLGRGGRRFAGGDLSRFGGSREAAEMVAYVLRNIPAERNEREDIARALAEQNTALPDPEALPDPCASPEALPDKFRGALVCALTMMLSEVYFTPDAKEMANYLLQTHKWFRQQLAALAALPQTEIDEWRRKNAARLRALSGASEPPGGALPPGTEASTLRKLLAAGGRSVTIDETIVFRPAIGRSRPAARATFRNHESLRSLSVNGGMSARCDFGPDLGAEGAPELPGTTLQGYRVRDLDRAERLRQERRQQEIDDYYFGEDGVGGGVLGGGDRTKEELRKAVVKLFETADVALPELDEAPADVAPASLLPPASSASTSPRVEDLPVDMETVSGTPAAIKSFKRTITHDKLTKHFSSEEHLKAEDWHGATKLHVTQAALDPADTSPGERRVLVASASVRDLETRPDWLYGPGSGRALMMGASSVGKSPPATSRARSAGSVVAEEAFAGTAEIRATLNELGGELVVKMGGGGGMNRRKSSSFAGLNQSELEEEEDDLDLDLDLRTGEEWEAQSPSRRRSSTAGSVSFGAESPPRTPEPEGERVEEPPTYNTVGASVGRHAYLRSPTVEVEEEDTYHLELSAALESERFLHNFEQDGGDADTWLLQHALLARRQPLTPRTAANVEKAEQLKAFLVKERKKSVGAPAAKKGGAKGGAKKKAPPKKAAGAGAEIVRKPIPPFLKESSDFIDIMLPTWKSEGKSLVRKNQLEEIEAIKQKFKAAEIGAKLSDESLEAALIFPQDKPCSIANLNMPRQGDGLMDDPVPRIPAAKVGGGGGAKKKKKGGGGGKKKKKK
ncbi:hypothetical protein TeGR_g12282 [Tetraparma gracilis]|uniref:Uncharacterized protein n=1 Tax=Tetraparma gracilis TaxID=2962635 RepID=A0ABQ6MX46_9STRA|nr:hypothetical protein TeGR_g12282 [Tetraparma gracilis]